MSTIISRKFDLGEFDDLVRVITPTSDGKLYVSGFFNTYKGVTENYFIRLNADGTKDTGFDNLSSFFAVTAIATTSDGKVYAGGNFTTYKGVADNNRIIRLNADGTKDTGFDNSTGFNFEVSVIKPTSDGKVYVGGNFTSYKGVTENRIIRLNADGTKDTGFDTGTGFNGSVSDIATTSDGKVYVGGNFTTYKGVADNNRIIRLNADGTKDTGFDNSTGFNSFVSVIAATSDGKVYAGGFFNTYKGVTENYFIRLNADGTKDTGFDNSTGFNSQIECIAATSDGKVYAGGFFTTYKGISAVYFTRLNADGTKDIAFDTGTGFNDYVAAIVPTSDGKVYAGGSFNTYKGETANYIIQLNADGTRRNTKSAVISTAGTNRFTISPPQ
jgi:uncharacterized delta-60 repeat protein